MDKQGIILAMGRLEVRRRPYTTYLCLCSESWKVTLGRSHKGLIGLQLSSNYSCFFISAMMPTAYAFVVPNAPVSPAHYRKSLVYKKILTIDLQGISHIGNRYLQERG